MKPNELKPLSEVIREVIENGEERKKSQIAYIDKDVKRTIEWIESTRLALALLHGAGFDLDVPWYGNGSTFKLDLGFFAQTKKGKAAMADAVKKVRETLGVKSLSVDSKAVADEKKATVEIHLKASEFPGLTIAYQRKLAPGAKCKIVKTRSTYTSLVCDNT